MQNSAALLPGETFDARRLLAPEQAVLAYAARVNLEPVGVETVALDDAYGRVLARDAIAREAYPAHPRSSMDGFAIVAASTPGTLRIAGEILMGRPPPGPLKAGQAMRIPTGGALPEGADAVVPVEDVIESAETIAVPEGVRAGDCFTPAASDIRAGERTIAAGRRVGGPELSVLATLGCTTVEVFRKPLFGIVSTGDELVPAGQRPGVGQVRDSNRYAIAGALRAMGADARHLPHAADIQDEIARCIRRGLDECDAVVLTGGSSVGVRDLTPRAIAELGAPGVVVHGLRVKPGKPTVLAAVGTKPVIGLPGNPTSALMILEAVVRPIVTALTGENARLVRWIEAVAEDDFVGREGWTWFVPVRLRSEGDTCLAQPLTLRSSHTSLLARAAGYAVLGESSFRISAGERVRVVPFACGGA